MISKARSTDVSVLFLEINEAEKYFLDKFVAEGKLPNLKRMLDGGVFFRTRVPGWDAGAEKAWRHISPWIIWPSVYTGMSPETHGLVGFGQDPANVVGRCVWDVLDGEGISTGILGCLMSYPPRTRGAGRYYVPESLADDPDCFPEEARALQEFCVFSARNYSESFSVKALEAVRLLLKTQKSGVRLSTVMKTLSQVPSEVVKGPASHPERAMLHSYLVWDAFEKLYPAHKPAYAAVHMNHVAYMQHRYWRAAEPERFEDALSLTDQRFFGTVDQRKAYELKFSRWIEKSFQYTDEVVGRILAMVDPNTVLLVGTALGQRPFDPAKEIHNPVVRLVRERELFGALGLDEYVVLHQMNPDVTINFQSEASATRAAELVRGLEVHPGEGLFTVQQKRTQLFLELNMPRRRAKDERFTIRHGTNRDLALDFHRFIHEHPTADQSTAHHKDSGWLLAYSPGLALEQRAKVISVTDIAPTILSLFGLPAQPWMEVHDAPAFAVKR
ncbi:MAG: alkaline phosphatase family protein [Planctomycetes bacterium]|nr:alkaline phosphatase family protein [Planctomycetota bacterium]